MKNNRYTLLILATLVLTACGGQQTKTPESVISSGDLSEIRSMKKEMEARQKKINEQLDSLNQAIARLDTIQKLPLVTTMIAKSTVFSHYVSLQGNVQTKQNVLVYPEMPGVLEQVTVKEGQRVSKGQLLASIADGGLRQQLAQVNTQAQLAKTVFERQERLWKQKIGSEMQYLQAKTNYMAQKELVDQVTKQLEKSQVRAPFDGIVDAIYKEQGTVMAPGMGSEMFRIVNLNKMYIKAAVPEKYITHITNGKSVEVFFPVLGKTVQTKVRHAGNYINPNNRTFEVELDVPNKDGAIKPNLTARLKINDYTNENAILIPQSIVSENAAGDQYVYVVTEGKTANEYLATRTIIATGKTQGDVIEVLSPLVDGMAVIEEGARSVNDGQQVKIINQ